jgi:hypothetical protein
MDWGKSLADILTSIVTWIVTGIVGPAVVAIFPSLRRWFLDRPWAISCGVAFLTSGLVTAAMWLALKPQPSIPAGAVLAFNGPCPSKDWHPFEPANARVILGAGTPTTKWKRSRPGGGFDEVDLTPRKLMDMDGEESHILSVREMPSHSHTFIAVQPGGGCAFSGCNANAQAQPRNTDAAGGDQPHNNLPPFVALTYCEKS